MTSRKFPVLQDNFEFSEDDNDNDDVHEDSIHSSSSTGCESVSYKIYDLSYNSESIPNGFNAVTISLDAGMKSNLNWQDALQNAKEALELNYKIFWDLNLGLFEALNSPLSNQQQFLSLKLAINHFNNTVWKEFGSHSVGVCLYRGNANFTDIFKWGDKEEENLKEYLNRTSDNSKAYIDNVKERIDFCRSASIDYIKLLAECLPDDAEPFAFIDLSQIDSLHEQARWQDSELAEPLRFAFFGSKIPLNRQYAWKEGQSPAGYINDKPLQIISPARSLAVWMPSDINAESETEASFEPLFHMLKEKNIHYRLIFEEKLIVEWDQLDHLIVISKSITPKVKRMLQGFCAAGGTVVYMGEALGLNQEIPFHDFIR